MELNYLREELDKKKVLISHMIDVSLLQTEKKKVEAYKVYFDSFEETIVNLDKLSMKLHDALILLDEKNCFREPKHQVNAM